MAENIRKRFIPEIKTIKPPFKFGTEDAPIYTNKGIVWWDPVTNQYYGIKTGPHEFSYQIPKSDIQPLQEDKPDKK